MGVETLHPCWTHYAVIDVETRGLARGQRYEDAEIVEISIVHMHLSHTPRLVLNTLVRPSGRVRRAHEHGLNDRDLADAPRFVEIAAHVRALMSGRVLVAHNIDVERRVLLGEMARAHVPVPRSPWLCTMRLARRLGIDPASLGSVSTAVGGRAGYGHAAASDAWSCARVLRRLLPTLLRLGVTSFGDLGDAAYATDADPPFGVLDGPVPRTKPRFSEASLRDHAERVWAYAEAVRTHVEQPAAARHASRGGLVAHRERHSGLGAGELRAAHALVLAQLLLEASFDDLDIDARVAARLEEAFGELEALGWTPATSSRRSRERFEG